MCIHTLVVEVVRYMYESTPNAEPKEKKKNRSLKCLAEDYNLCSASRLKVGCSIDGSTGTVVAIQWVGKAASHAAGRCGLLLNDGR